MRNEWGLKNEEEDEYRRKLLVRARKGDIKAQAELIEKYGMRVYSDTERAKMPTYYDSGKKGSASSSTLDRTPASIPGSSKPSQGKAKTRTELRFGSLREAVQGGDLLCYKENR